MLHMKKTLRRLLAGGILFSSTAFYSCGKVAEVTESGPPGGATLQQLAVKTTTVPVVPVGVPYKEPIIVAGGQAPYTFTVSLGSLPTGLALTKETGVIEGTVEKTSAGVKSQLVVKVTDNLGLVAESPLALEVSGYAITMFPEVLPEFSPGFPVDYKLTPIGATPPITFTLQGKLPTGIELNSIEGRFTSNGVAINTDQQDQTFPVTIIATDSNKVQLTKTYDVKISKTIPTPTLTISAQNLSDALAGGVYTGVVFATGGFSPYAFSLTEGTLHSGLTLDPTTGVITGTVPRTELNVRKTFTVKVTDAALKTAQRTYSIQAGAYSIVLTPEEVASVVPEQAYSLKFTPVGATAPVTYAMSGNLPTGLSLDSALGKIQSGVGGVPISEQNTTKSFEIQATDANGIRATRSYTIAVAAATATPPLAFVTTSLSNPVAGSAYADVVAVTGGFTPYAFALATGSTLHTGLTLDAVTGKISGTVPRSILTTPADHLKSPTIKVTDAKGTEVNRGFAMLAGPYTFVIAPDAISQVTPQSNYSFTFTAAGATAPIGWAITGGSLPAGLTLNTSAGRIEKVSTGVGTGDQNTSWDFTITATDTNGVMVAKTYSVANSNPLTVGPAIITPALQITTASLPTPVGGQAYASNFSASGGSSPYTFSIQSGALPSGVTIANAASGVISGPVPFSAVNAATNAWSFTVLVTDSASATATKYFEGPVSAYTVSIAPTTLSAGVPSSSYSNTFTAYGGQAPYTYVVDAGTLPSGLTLSSSGGLTGVIAESEAGVTRNFDIKATDSKPGTPTSAIRSYTLATASFTTTISTTTLSNAAESVTYAGSIVATGGTAPYTIQYTGALPSGLGMTNAGSIFGIPAANSGSLIGTVYNISVRATDVNGNISAWKPLTLTVGVTLPVLSASAISGATLGSQYSKSLTASGGRGPYTFQVSGGVPPTGINLSTAGVFSGLPSVAVTCPAGNFTATVTDSLTQASSPATTICIPVAQGVSITNTSFPTITVGTNYNTTVTATGGVTAYSFSATDLPSGISLNSSSGLLSGFTNAAIGDYQSYIHITDSSSPTPLTTTRSLTFSVRDPLALPSASLSMAAAAPSPGTAYSTSLVSATGGFTPISHVVTSGSLPGGLSMASNGVISGSPVFSAATSPSYSFTVTATDARGQTASRAFSIALAVAPRVTTTTLPIAVVGVDYGAILERAGGFNEFSGAGVIASRLSWTMSGHPTGLSINTTSGRLSGSISGAPGTYSLVIGVTDGNGFSHSKTIPLVVNAAGKRLDLGAARFSEPCLRNNTACDPRAYAVGRLTNTTQQFAVYSNNLTAPRSIQIARISSTGHIPALSENGFSVAVALPAVFGATSFINSIQIADLDQDGYRDIVFVDASVNRTACALWGSSSVTTAGMPSGYSSASMTCWVVPQGFDAANNTPYYMTVRNDLRPDAANYGKQDLVVASSNTSSTGSSAMILRNVCAVNGNCSGARATLFNGYLAAIVGTTNATTTMTTTDTTGVVNGQPIFGSGIPVGTTVASFVVNTSITLSAAATTSVTSGRFSVMGGGGAAVTATTTTTSATLTAVTSTTGIVPGMSITGTGIPAGTSVVSFSGAGPGATITMSQAATATATLISIKAFGPSNVMPQLGVAAAAKMLNTYEISFGYFDIAGPNPPTTYATSQATCPSIVIGGHRVGTPHEGYLYTARQQWDGSACVGDFQVHSGTTADEQLVASFAGPWLSAVSVADYNKDGISDIAVGMSQPSQANSANVRTYLMPGLQTFVGATSLLSQLQSQNGLMIGVARMMPYCIDGSVTCDYPSLLVVCDKPPVHGGKVGTGSCLSVLPNQCTEPGCTTIFETGTPSKRIDYPAPYGQYNQAVVAPIVSTSNATPTGNTSSGSAVILSVSNTADVSLGQPITGTGIPTNTVVTAKTADTITLSQNASQTNTGITVTTPVVATRQDVVLMGSDPTGATRPFFLVYGRNSNSTTDPLKSGLHLSGFPASYFVPVEIGTMKISDINGDGKLDLFANIVNQGSVSTYVSNNTSTPKYLLNATQTPKYLATPGDFGCPSSEASCLPDPVFNTMGASHGYPGTAGAWHMQNTMDVGDVNNDGIDDVAVVGYQSRGLSVALGSTNGDLSSSVLFDAGTGGDIRPQALVLADLDQDGFMDMAVASITATGTQTSYISWLKGNGDGTFQTAQQIPGITSFGTNCNDPRSISAVDLNADGRPELSILCYNSPASVVFIARRHTNGSWLLQSGSTINVGGGAGGTVMKWGRLTSTTGTDVVVTGLDLTNNVRIINNVTATVTSAATGAFTVSSTPGVYFNLYGYPSDIDIADLNGDGYGDLAIAMQSQNGSGTQQGGVFYSCLSSSSAGTCTPLGWGLEGYQMTSILARDVTGDGLPEIFTGFRANSTLITSLIYRTIGRTMNGSN